MFVIQDTRNGCSVGVAKRFGFHLLVLLRDLAFLCSENRCLSGSRIDVFQLSVIDGLTTHCLDFSLLAVAEPPKLNRLKCANYHFKY